MMPIWCILISKELLCMYPHILSYSRLLSRVKCLPSWHMKIIKWWKCSLATNEWGKRWDGGKCMHNVLWSNNWCAHTHTHTHICNVYTHAWAHMHTWINSHTHPSVSLSCAHSLPSCSKLWKHYFIQQSHTNESAQYFSHRNQPLW